MSVDIEKYIRAYLPEVIHMSLATSKDGKPWICEVHYAFDEDLNLYFRSLTSRRHSQEIAQNPSVAGNMTKQVGLDQPCMGVVDFEGKAELLAAGPEQDRAFECIKQRFSETDEILKQAQDPKGNQFYKVTVEKWYVFGKLDGQSPQKYKLGWNRNEQ